MTAKACIDIQFIIDTKLSAQDVIHLLTQLKDIIYDRRQLNKFKEWQDDFHIIFLKNSKQSAKSFDNFDLLASQALKANAFHGIGIIGTDYTTLDDGQVFSSLYFLKSQVLGSNLSAIRAVIDTRLLSNLSIHTQNELINFGTQVFSTYKRVSGYIDLVPEAPPLPFEGSYYEVCQRLSLINKDVAYFQQYLRGYSWTTWLNKGQVNELLKSKKSFDELQIFSIDILDDGGKLLRLTENIHEVTSNDLLILKTFLHNLLDTQENPKIRVYFDKRFAQPDK